MMLVRVAGWPDVRLYGQREVVVGSSTEEESDMICRDA